MTFRGASMSEPRPVHADTVCEVHAPDNILLRVSQLKQVPEWSLIRRVLLLQRTARTYRRHGTRCSGSAQEEATDALACAAGIVLGVPARAPDTLMHMRQTSQSVVKFPSIRQTAQPVRALAGPIVRPGL